MRNGCADGDCDGAVSQTCVGRCFNCIDRSELSRQGNRHATVVGFGAQKDANRCPVASCPCFLIEPLADALVHQRGVTSVKR